MWTEWREWARRAWRLWGRAAELNTGVVPLPTGSNSAQGSGFQSVDGYFISSQTEARQACWEWITFLTTQPSAASGLPARQDVAESDEYRQQVGEERADAYLASVSVGNRASFFQRMADEGNWLMFASIWLSNAYNSIVEGEMTVEEALADAQTKVDDYRTCVIANDAFDDMQALRSCAQRGRGDRWPGRPSLEWPWTTNHNGRNHPHRTGDPRVPRRRAGDSRLARRRPGCRRGQGGGPARPVGFGQDDAAQLYRRAGPANSGAGSGSRART